MKIPQDIVHADRVTGEWIGEPAFVGLVEVAGWHAKQDTDDVHFDTYEALADDGVTTVTRAIQIVWM